MQGVAVCLTSSWSCFGTFRTKGTAHFVVVGSQAVYAYEAAGGVRITSKAADQANEWRKNVDSQISFVTDLIRQDDAFIERTPQRIDHTFTCSNARGLIATNARGFRASFLRHQPLAVDSDPALWIEALLDSQLPSSRQMVPWRPCKRSRQLST